MDDENTPAGVLRREAAGSDGGSEGARRRMLRAAAVTFAAVQTGGCGGSSSRAAAASGSDGAGQGASDSLGTASAEPPPPAPPAPALPSWVPPPGEIAVLTNANGRLANRFRDIVAPYYDPFSSVKVVNDYSGAFKNPHWGRWGCTVFFGGGHAGTNDNMVAIAEYGDEAITFRRVCDPTPWFGNGTDAVTRRRNSVDNANALLDPAYMESRADGKPGAPHSYGSGDIVGPEHGGAACGTYLQVIAAAVNYANDGGAVAAHELPFDDTTTPSDLRRWRRVTDATATRTFGPWPAPILTAYVGAQQRVYITPNGPHATGPVRWFDRNTRTWVRGTGMGFGYGESDGYDSGIVFHVPSRGLLVCMYPLDGRLKVQWMDVTVAQPTLGPPVVLGVQLAVADPWSAACWCPLNERILVAGVTGDPSAVYEVAIPARPENPWPVARAPLGSGQTLVPPDRALGRGATWKKFHYDEKVRAVVYMPLASPDGDDTIWVYRPRGT